MAGSVLEIPAMQNIGWAKYRTAQTTGGPLPAGTVVVSADSHLLEPPNMWVDRVPAHLKDRAPRLHRDEEGFHLEIPGKDLPPVTFLTLCAFECVPGALEQAPRIRDIDAEGVDKEILFPQKSLGLISLDDVELRHACIRAYNEYLSEFCAAAPERFYGVGLLRYWDPAATRDDLQELKALGFKACMVPQNPGDGIHYNGEAMDPFWEAIEEAGLPLCYHVGENFRGNGPGAGAAHMLISIGGFRHLWGLLTFSGLFDRHPGLRVVFTEGGISWVSHALYDADMLYSGFGADMQPKLSHDPSYYWFQNCYATFMTDPGGLELIHRIGADRVLWSSDYPHNESTLGYTRSAVAEVFKYTGEEQGKAIVGGNAIKLFGLT